MIIRSISALIALLISIPILLKGGNIYNIFICIISLIALKEFFNLREGKKEIPDFIKFISYLAMILIVLGDTSSSNIVFNINYTLVAAIILIYLLPILIYHNNKYNVQDAFYLIGVIFFLGMSFHLLVVLRNVKLDTIIYLLTITIMTDTFAYLTGSLIGKIKLFPSISPKKTWEGLIGGIIMGVFVSSMFYLTVINSNINIYLLILITFFLSLVGQLGDLVFSSLKRHYGIKDFSNIMPGHGGVLDRLDSIIFVVFGYMFFMSIL